METIFDFEKSRKYITINLPEKKDNIIKLAGTVDDPYFCAKDVCEILEMDMKQSLEDCIEKKINWL